MTHPSILASQAAPPSTPPSAAASGATHDFVWPDEAACQALAARLAEAVRPTLLSGGSLTLELHGTLGAGKTTFTRHLLRTLGVQGRIKSPSYAVVEPHGLPGMAIHHFDFYRFNDPQEWEDAGFRDIFGAPGLKLVEWPEKAAGLLPQADLALHIEVPAEDVNDVDVAVGRDATTDAGTDAPVRHVRLRPGTPVGHAAMARLLAAPAPQCETEVLHG